MCSERKRLANQRNAQKSTGPKTEEGKARCRRNALKHGLTGQGIVLSKADQARMEAKLAMLKKNLEPINELEEQLVQRMALALVRMEKCTKQEAADTRRRKNRALKRWEQKQLQIAEEISEGLLSNKPWQAVEALESSSTGCDWLIQQWQSLADLLDSGQWTPELTDRALRMLGIPGEPDEDEPDAYQLARLARQVTDEAPEADRESAKAALLALIQLEQERLDEIAEQLYHELDEPAREEVEDLAGVNTTPAAARLRAYENSSEVSYHRNLSKLIHIRKIEPEHQSIDRFHKTGRMKPRRWNGTTYEPTDPHYWSTWDEYKARQAEAEAARAASAAGQASGAGSASPSTGETPVPQEPEPPARNS